MRPKLTVVRVPAFLAVIALLLLACRQAGSPEGTADAASQAGTGTSGGNPTPPDVEIPEDATAEQRYAALAELPREERDVFIEECAKEEGEIVWYAVQNVESLEAWADGFMELHPEIAVSFSRGKTADITDKTLAEARADRHLVDVIQVGGTHLSLLHQEGLIANHRGVPAPEGYPDNAVGDWWMSLALNPNLITYNTDLVSPDDAPQGYEDLLDGKWKGKVAIDVSPQNMIIAMVREWGEERARDYLTQLVVDNDALVRKGHTNMTNLVAAGEFPVAIELYSYKVAELIDDGAPLAWVAPELIPANTDSQGIAADAPHPCAAVLFSNYLLSEQGGEVYAQSGRLHNNPNVEPLYPSIAGLVGDERLSPNTPDDVTDEQVEQTLALIEEIIVPAYTRADGELEPGDIGGEG